MVRAITATRPIAKGVSAREGAPERHSQAEQDEQITGRATTPVAAENADPVGSSASPHGPVVGRLLATPAIRQAPSRRNSR